MRRGLKALHEENVQDIHPKWNDMRSVYHPGTPNKKGGDMGGEEFRSSIAEHKRSDAFAASMSHNTQRVKRF